MVTLCSSPLFFIVVSVHHHHHALFTIFPLPGARHLPTMVSLPGAPPSATFWKVCLGSVKASFVCAPKGKYPGKKRQGANILKKTRKAKKEGKENPHHTRQQNYIWGAGLFPCWAPPPFPVLGFGAIFFLISDCQVLERRILAVVSHPDLGAGLPLWIGTH